MPTWNSTNSMVVSDKGRRVTLLNLVFSSVENRFEPFKTPSFPNKARVGGSTCVSKNNFQAPDLKWGCIPETELSTYGSYGLVSYKIKGVCSSSEGGASPHPKKHKHSTSKCSCLIFNKQIVVKINTRSHVLIKIIHILYNLCL